MRQHVPIRVLSVLTFHMQNIIIIIIIIIHCTLSQWVKSKWNVEWMTPAALSHFSEGFDLKRISKFVIKALISRYFQDKCSLKKKRVWGLVKYYCLLTSLTRFLGQFVDRLCLCSLTDHLLMFLQVSADVREIEVAWGRRGGGPANERWPCEIKAISQQKNCLCRPCMTLTHSTHIHSCTHSYTPNTSITHIHWHTDGGLDGEATSDLAERLRVAAWLRLSACGRTDRSQKENVSWTEIRLTCFKSRLGTTDEWQKRLREKYDPFWICKEVPTVSAQMQHRIMLCDFMSISHMHYSASEKCCIMSSVALESGKMWI